jgi:TolB protein
MSAPDEGASQGAAQAEAPTGEPLVVWALYALMAAAIFATYARTPVSELYHVSGNGTAAAAGRVLVALNWSTALAAMGTLVFAADRGGRGTRIAAAISLALCAAIFWPGVVQEADLDAKWSNVIAAAGVVLAFALTVRGARPVAFAAWTRSDVWRCVLAAVVLFVSLPWVLAVLGLGVDSVPGLGSIFYGEQLWAPLGESRLHEAVHPGEHHGLDGALLVLTALLLSRRIGAVNGTRLRWAARVYCAAMLGYGLANVINDAWYEQLVKRGVLRWPFPSMIQPAPTVAWAILLATVGLLVVLVFRSGARTRSVTLSPAWALVLVPALAAGVVIGVANDASASSSTGMPGTGAAAALRRHGLVAGLTARSGPRIYAMRGDGSAFGQLPQPAKGAAPDWSPATHRIVFQSVRDGNSEIYSMNEDGGEVRRLTHHDAADAEPAWSPDGRRIAFVSDRGGGDDVYVMDADGSHVRRLTSGEGADEWPAWSPDGRAIAFDSDVAGSYDVYVVPSGGGTPRRLTDGGAEDRFPRWFPGGKDLVFESDAGGTFSLYTLAVGADGERPRRLTDGRGNDFGPAVSRDGEWVAFVSDRDGNDQLYAVRRDGSGLVRLTSDMADRGVASWTR